jgi:hypothetical protein
VVADGRAIIAHAHFSYHLSVNSQLDHESVNAGRLGLLKSQISDVLAVSFVHVVAGYCLAKFQRSETTTAPAVPHPSFIYLCPQML